MASSLGLPQIEINFSSQATTAITRSARGVVSIILNDENVTDDDGVKYSLIEDSSDIPSTGISDNSKDALSKVLVGTPYKVHAYFIPPANHEEEQEKVIERTVDSEVVVTRTVDSDVTVSRDVDSDVIVTDPDTGETSTQTITVTITDTEVQPVSYTDTEIQTIVITDTVVENVTVDAQITQADVLKKCANVRFNYICHPTGSAQDQQNLATWVANQRANKHKTYKAVVANYAADNYGVINFTTGKIKVVNPAYTTALANADGDESEVDVLIPKYITYTAAQYTARIAGILAGLPLDRSATYYVLSEVVEVEEYDDIDEHINNGELCLIDEKDDNGVKIARACNSLTTFSSTVGEDFRFIKIIESIDLIKEDIREAFRNDYVGKIINTYDNKMLFVAAIHSYFNGLEGNVLNRTSSNSNYVEIDYNKNAAYAKSRGADIDSMSRQQIIEYNTGTNVFLTGRIMPVNAMEDLLLTFTLE